MLSWLEKLVRAPEHVKSSDERQRIFLTSTMVLAFFVLMIACTILIFVAAKPDDPTSPRGRMLIVVFLYGITYLISRTKYYKLAAYIFISQLVLGIFSSTSIDPNLNNVLSAMDYYIIAVLLSSILLSNTATLVFGMISGISILVVPSLNPHIPIAVMAGKCLAIAGASVLAFLSASIQKRFVRRAETAEKDALLNLSQVDSMLQSMEQGILTINPKLEVDPNYSKHLESILEQTNISARLFKEVILDRTNLSSEAKQMTLTALRNCLGEDPINFDLNAHIFPSRAVLFVQNVQKTIEISFTPIIVDNIVIKILLVLKDVTQIEKLKKQADEQNAELQKIFRILKISKANFNQFIASSQQFIQRCHNLLAGKDTPSTEELAQIFRNLHTLKGNSRALGFDDLSLLVHEAEDFYDKKRFNSEGNFAKAEIIHQLEKVSECFASYNKIYSEKIAAYGIDKEKQSSPLPDLNLLLTAREVFQIQAQNKQPEISDKISQVAKFFESLYSESFGSLVQHIIEDVPNLAKKLDKPTPLVLLAQREVLIPTQFQDVIKDVMMHLIRNSIDHGIETASERAARGKKDLGQINIECKETSEIITIEFQDDGQGLDFEKIFGKGKKMGILTEADRENPRKVLECVFRSSFTTKEQVTEISGRGVGLDVVKGFIEEQAGRVRLDFGAPSLSGFYPFKIIIEIPKVAQIVIEENRSLLTGIKVVIVEDDRDQLERLEESFLSSDIKPKCYASATEALTYCLENDVDVIISDLIMPKMDGKSFFYELKKKQRVPSMFILLTGYYEISLNDLVKEGVSIIFSKPISPITIINHLKNSLSSRKKSA